MLPDCEVAVRSHLNFSNGARVHADLELRGIMTESLTTQTMKDVSLPSTSYAYARPMLVAVRGVSGIRCVRMAPSYEGFEGLSA